MSKGRLLYAQSGGVTAVINASASAVLAQARARKIPVYAGKNGILGILREQLGQRILRYASLDDIAIWGVLALILLDWERIERQGIFLAGFAAAAFLIRKMMARLSGNDRWAVGLIWLALCGLAADWSGLHYMVGAFLAGAALDAKWFGIEKIDAFRDIVLLTIMPVFFLSTGIMGLNFLGVDSFVQNLFYGGGLVIAVSISQLIRGRKPME